MSPERSEIVELVFLSASYLVLSWVRVLRYP